MTLNQALREWQFKNCGMGCREATKWFCRRVEGFLPVEITRYCEDGESYVHVIASNGKIRIDLTPENDGPDTTYENESAVARKGKIDYQ